MTAQVAGGLTSYPHSRLRELARRLHSFYKSIKQLWRRCGGTSDVEKDDSNTFLTLVATVQVKIIRGLRPFFSCEIYWTERSNHKMEEKFLLMEKECAPYSKLKIHKLLVDASRGEVSKSLEAGGEILLVQFYSALLSWKVQCLLGEKRELSARVRDCNGKLWDLEAKWHPCYISHGNMFCRAGWHIIANPHSDPLGIYYKAGTQFLSR